MKNKLILIEGIPGSGKSTIAIKLKDYLISQGEKVRIFSEGDYHPADLAWNAYLNREQYAEILEKYPEIKEEAEKLKVIEDEHIVVPYTQLRPKENAGSIFGEFAKYEIYDGKVSLDRFKEISLKRWGSFAAAVQDDEIVIFECAYLQNQICELLGFYNESKDEIILYMNSLIEKVKSLNPKMIYLSQESVEETISRVAMERKAPGHDGIGWIDNVIMWIEGTPYGKVHHLEGFKGAIEFFEARKKIELAVIDSLSIDTKIIDNKDYNWEKVFTDIINTL